MALQIRRFQEERDRWEIDREELECQANSATAECDELLEVITFSVIFHQIVVESCHQLMFLFRIVFKL